MSSPSALLKVNCLVMRYLHFGSVRGDLQEGYVCSSRCQLPLFPIPVPIYPSTKSRFLCAFASKFFPIMVFMSSLPTASSRWLSASAPPVSSPQRPGQQHFPDGALPRLRLSQGAPPRRPGQQQTSSDGEKYSGLASNLAHLGRIC